MSYRAKEGGFITAKNKCIYTRVSTAIQIDGYFLDAQKTRMRAYADFNNYEIVGE